MFDFTQPIFIAATNPLTGVGLDLDQFQKLRYEFYINSESLELINETLGVSLKAAGTSAGSANSLTFLLAAMVAHVLLKIHIALLIGRCERSIL